MICRWFLNSAMYSWTFDKWVGERKLDGSKWLIGIKHPIAKCFDKFLLGLLEPTSADLQLFFLLTIFF